MNTEEIKRNYPSTDAEITEIFTTSPADTTIDFICEVATNITATAGTVNSMLLNLLTIKFNKEIKI
jgi:hypothetical protein